MVLTPNEVRRRARVLLEQVRTHYADRLNDEPWIGPAQLPNGTIEECMNIPTLVWWCEQTLAKDDETLLLDMEPEGNA